MPSRGRSDQGRENVSVADFMIEHRGTGKVKMLTGKSTHNQRIERLRRDVFEGIIAFYFEIFTFLEDNAILDPFSEIDLAVLHSDLLERLRFEKRFTSLLINYGIEKFMGVKSLIEHHYESN